ncbi:hypothetical protein BJ508DRAFT_61799 [Ascobolus immersus RN42]|uniref:Uncharacterized protein n=1 Tax=Ascobolus immersus RN42 TaxID=1160509 RepID=A0A3N4IS39_ASCIM|nr:hypothetical protein BJ508DRAFT_61799 [Ascobolus immersus RN42]
MGWFVLRLEGIFLCIVSHHVEVSFYKVMLDHIGFYFCSHLLLAAFDSSPFSKQLWFRFSSYSSYRLSFFPWLGRLLLCRMTVICFYTTFSSSCSYHLPGASFTLHIAVSESLDSDDYCGMGGYLTCGSLCFFVRISGLIFPASLTSHLVPFLYCVLSEYVFIL